MTADPHEPDSYPRSAKSLKSIENELTPDLADLCQSQVEPVLLRYFSRKLRSSMRQTDDNRANQDALELISEAKVRILRRLCKSGLGTGSEIGDIEAYTRAVARNVFNQYLRSKYPRRLSVKNQCRYLFTHHQDLDLWKGENDLLICSLNSAEDRPTRAAAFELSPEELAELRGSIGPKRETAAASEVIEAVFLILRDVKRPVALDDLVSAVMEMLRIEEPAETGQPDEISNLTCSASSAQSNIEEKEFVRRLWSEILQLPVRHRAALLLNFRDENGDDLAAAIVANGAAAIRDIAAAVEIEAEEFARVWKELPWEDMRIAAYLGLERQQVINLRQSAKQKLRRKLSQV